MCCVLFLLFAIIFTLRATLMFTLKSQRTSGKHQQLTRHHKILSHLHHRYLTYGCFPEGLRHRKRIRDEGRKVTKFFGPITIQITSRNASSLLNLQNDSAYQLRVVHLNQNATDEKSLNKVTQLKSVQVSNLTEIYVTNNWLRRDSQTFCTL